MIRVGMPENVNPQCCLSFPNHKIKTIENKQLYVCYSMCLILYLIIRIVLSILLLLCYYVCIQVGMNKPLHIICRQFWNDCFIRVYLQMA